MELIQYINLKRTSMRLLNPDTFDVDGLFEFIKGRRICFFVLVRKEDGQYQLLPSTSDNPLLFREIPIGLKISGTLFVEDSLARLLRVYKHKKDTSVLILEYPEELVLSGSTLLYETVLTLLKVISLEEADSLLRKCLSS